MHLTKEDYLKVLLPTKREMWIVIAVLLVVFFVYEGNLIFLRITNNTIFTSPGLAESFNNQIDAFLGNNFFLNKASLVIFWAGVGLVAYSIIWAIYNFVFESKSEVVVATEYVNQVSKKEKLQRNIFQIAGLVVIITLGLVSINITVPYLIGLWTAGILAIPSEWIFGSLQIVAGFVGLSTNLYLFKVFIDWIVILD